MELSEHDVLQFIEDEAEDGGPAPVHRGGVHRGGVHRGGGGIAPVHGGEGCGGRGGRRGKHATHCCVTSEKGEQWKVKLNLTSAGTGSTINHLSAEHGINLQCGLIRQTETAYIIFCTKY